MSKGDQKVTNTVSTPTNPQWVTDASQNIVTQGQSLMGKDPQSFIAGPQQLNANLFDIAGGLGTQGAGQLGQAGGLYSQLAGSGPNLATGSAAGAAGYNPAMMTGAHIAPTQGVTGSSAVGGINSYLNPASAYVAGNTIANLDRARQLTLNNNGDGAALAGQYGGSRQGVLDANTNRDFYSTLGTTLGNLYSQDFNTALGASQSDADRSQQANIFSAGAANDRNTNQAQLDQQTGVNNQNANNQAWQFNAGNAQQSGLTNAQLAQQNSQFNAGQQDSVYTRMLQGAQGLGGLGQFGVGALSDAGNTQQGLAQQQAGAPLSVYSLLSGDYQNALPQLFQGSTQNQTQGVQQGTLSKIGNGLKIGSSVVQTLGSIFSDARLKRDIETVGYDAKGRRWVDYRYGWDADDAPKTRGVIAQEIAETDPDAVLMHPTGLLMVNYDMLGA
jgi:hypothetical protein